MPPYRNRVVGLACAAAALAVWPASSRAIVSTNTNGFPFDGININQFIGAEDFYLLGYTGSRAVIANVEAGHIWDGHDDTSAHLVINPITNTYDQFVPGTVAQYINDPSLGDHTNLYDWHATMVGQVLGGFGTFDYGFELQDNQGNKYNSAWGYGIAPFAQIWSTAIASQFNPTPGTDFSGSFEITQQSFTYGYVTTMQTGVNGRKADVINSSWGFDDPDGSANETKVIDALAYANHQTVVIAAGNHDSGNPAVGGPASGFNSISVAALASDTSSPYYGYVAGFSNHGVNDFTNPKIVGPNTVPASRVAVDIAAPGDNLTLAAYLGLTGGHTSNALLNLDAATLASTGNYFVDVGGTSFASPIVAASASLLVDMGYDRFGGGTSVDGRVIKAMLLNSATKNQGWDNGEAADVRGVIRTSQALDASTGTGMLNLHQALVQYSAGATDLPGTTVSSPTVPLIGWDYAVSTPGVDNDYYLAGLITGGAPLAVTLDWFVNRVYDDATQTATDVSFADLDLEVWRVLNGLPLELVATSESAYSNVEHLYFAIPSDGEYMLRVHYFGDAYDANPADWQAEPYAIAWMTPEPSGVLLLVVAGLPVAMRRRRTAGRACGTIAS